ncbi:MAG: ParB N-terminal domain-containing protein [Pseudomonadota bacterium]
MNLQFIDLDDLTVSKLNVRKHGAKDIADLKTSIAALGVLQPLLVRPHEEGGFEVIAGQRRLNACRALAREAKEAKQSGEPPKSEPIPCLIMEDGEDAAAIEASLAENIERLPMDEIDQFKALSKLVKEGRGVEDIAATFGITERMVQQRLALGRLYAPILNAYRRNDIHARDLRNLTMATMKQQKAWWALVKDEEAYVPTGSQLKDWLFGGAHIPTSNAIFDVEASELAVVSDLFGEEAYFADATAFWKHQDDALHMLATCYEASGWEEAVTMERGAYFATWDHRKTSKKDCGKVFIAVSQSGEVSEHEGYITNAEAKRRKKAAKGKDAQKAEKPELTKPALNYVDLHRHATVRADLLGHSSVALRVIAAHMLAGSDLWHVGAEPQRAAKPEFAASLEQNKGQERVEGEREAIAALMDCELHDGYTAIADIFGKLQSLSDEEVLRVLTYLMAETLSVHSPLIDTLGQTMETKMRDYWAPDETFFGLVRDKEILNAMVGEYAGEVSALGNSTEPAKTQRSILNSCSNGARTPADPMWVPRYFSFPRGSYRRDANFEGKAVQDHQHDAEHMAA